MSESICIVSGIEDKFTYISVLKLLSIILSYTIENVNFSFLNNNFFEKGNVYCNFLSSSISDTVSISSVITEK